MNGVHDMGGMHGLGPIAPEPDEPVVHAEWERRVHALAIASAALDGTTPAAASARASAASKSSMNCR